MKKYLGNSLQIRGAERYTLEGGKGNGMRFICVRNGCGLEAWISLDRAGDLSRVTFKGENMGYFSPCGYVAPQYYDNKGIGFLKSFTAGFFTTCGLTNIGNPCTDEGEELPLHGTISNIPSEDAAISETKEGIEISVTVRDYTFTSQKLALKRKYFFSYTENTIAVNDTVVNEGINDSPYALLYHCNMAYPLLTEKSIVKIPNKGIKPRSDFAAEHIATALTVDKPTTNAKERCYYFDVNDTNGIASAGIYNEDINKGVIISYDKSTLPCFTEWQMFDEIKYVLGLEPCTCELEGRDVLRKNNQLEFIEPGEAKNTSLTFKFVDKKSEFDAF